MEDMGLEYLNQQIITEVKLSEVEASLELTDTNQKQYLTLTPSTSNDKTGETYNQEPRLVKILKLHPHGLSILAYYSKVHTLNKSLRNLLTRLIIYKEHEGKSTVECLPASRYIELSTEICATFRSEVQGTYYTPHSGASGGGAVQSARGMLLAFNTYLRKQHLKQIQGAKRSIFPAIVSVLPTICNSESLNFVQTYIEPFEEVEKNWISSFNERQRDRELLNISAYFKKFPCLKQTYGYKLLQHDFDLKFPDQKDAFTNNWPGVLQKLKYLFSGPRQPSDPDLKAVALGLPFFKDDSLDLAVFLLISDAFPKPRCISKTDNKDRKFKRPRTEKSQESKGWTPTKPEAREGFIFHVKTANDVKTSLQKLQNTLATYDLPLQPRPVIVGSVNNIISAHLYIDEVQYDLNSASQAVEVAFKTYYALNAQYPPEAKPAWIFIEQAVFQLKIKSEKSIPTSVTALLGELKINFGQEN